MKIIDNGVFTQLLADDGMVICSMDGAWGPDLYIKEVCLGVDDVSDNYFEVEELKELE